MIDWWCWPLRSLLRAVVLSPAREFGQEVASAWGLGQAPRYSTGFGSGAYPGSSAIWITAGAVEVLAHDPALVLRCAVADGEQPALEVRAQRLEELHDLSALYRTVVQPEQEGRADQPGDSRDVLPVEV